MLTTFLNYMLIDRILAKLFPGVIKEYKFHPTRKWKFDYAWPDKKVALEQEGGIWIQGRHSRGKGMQADMEKYNEAVVLGWFVVRATPEMLSNGQAFEVLRRIL